MSKHKFWIFFCGLLWFQPLLYSQIEDRDRPLIEVIQEIQARYRVNFTYADATVDGIFLRPPGRDLSLNATLNYLERQTGLLFELLNNSNIIIRPVLVQDITNIQYLEEVVVTDYLTRGISLKNTGVTQIRPDRFGILPGLTEPDVLQTIQALPGVMSVDERVSNLNVRGGTNDQNLILWDGIKMYQSGHFFGLISAFNPYLTEKVVVSKNGTSVRYGDGVSSIIDMRSSSKISEDFEGGAGLNLISADAYAKIPIGQKAEMQLSARRSFTDLLSTPTYDQYFKRIFQDTDITNRGGSTLAQNESFYFTDATARFKYNINERSSLSMNAVAIYNNLQYDEQSTINDISESLQSSLIQQNLAVGAEYVYSWNPDLLTTAQVYLSNYDLDATNFDILNEQRLIQENEVYDSGLRLHLDYNMAENLSIFGGYQFTEVGISNLEDVNNPVFRRFIKEVLRSHALFNEVQFVSDSKRTNARVGLRVNYIDKLSEFFIEPRFSLSQRIGNDFRLEILGEIKTQSTTQIIDLQNDFLGVEKRRWILANGTTVPVLESGQISAGLHYNRNRLLISLEGYYKTVDGITTRSQGFQNQYQFLDATGGYDVSGFDFLINKKWRNLSAWFSYSYSENNYSFEDLNFGRDFPNNFDIRHSFTLASTYSLNAFKLAVGMNYHSGRPFTEVNSENPITSGFINYDSPNTSNLPDYLRVDTSATYEFQLGEIQTHVGLSIWNLLDRKNVINTYFLPDSDDNVVKINNESLGLTPNLSLRISF